jgi:hypothetical protein
MARNPYPVQWPLGKRTEVRRAPIASGQTYKAGELVVLSSNELVVCGADPVLVSGIACEAAADTIETGYGNYYVADAKTIWAIESDTTPVFDTHNGVSYGVVAASGVWKLDILEVTTLVFTVVGTIENVTPKLFLVKFHADALS